MCKKVLVIATLAVLAAVFVVGGPRAVSYLRYWKHQLRTSFEESISPEDEINRLSMELDNLPAQEKKMLDTVARQLVEVKKLQTQVKQQETDLAQHETYIKELNASLESDDQFVTFKGTKKARKEWKAELRQEAAEFRLAEATLQSKQEQLKAKKQTFNLNKKKLDSLRLEQQKMRTELEQLKRDLARERQAQAQEKATVDDAGFLRIRESMDSLRDRMEILKAKRELRGEIRSRTSTRASAEQRKKDAEQDEYIKTRFGASKAKAQAETDTQ